MIYKNIFTSINNQVLLITINRTESYNTLSLQCMEDISDVLTNVESDEAVKCIIITGAGDKAFISGADINEFKALKSYEGEVFSRNGHLFINSIENFNKPIIAAINGYALGGGCEVAMACHLRIASENAYFGQPEIKLGIMPGYGGTQRILQYLGKNKALEYLLLGKRISAEEALNSGLVNEVVPLNQLLIRAQELAEIIASYSSTSVTGILKAVNAYYSSGENGFEEEMKAFGECIKTTNFREGISAFLEKRKPSFE